LTLALIPALIITYFVEEAIEGYYGDGITTLPATRMGGEEETKSAGTSTATEGMTSFATHRARSVYSLA
jgi:hypothetical protein